MNKRTLLSVIVLTVTGLMLGGCEQVDPADGYTSRNLYRTDVKTVCVEMFKSKSFRREIEYEITRAVCQQLELHSPYKVVSNKHKADTVLYGTLVRVDEGSLSQQRDLDRPIENQLVLVADVTWKDRRSGQLLLDELRIKVSSRYAALLGEGRQSAVREAANELAVRIVEAMEEPW